MNLRAELAAVPLLAALASIAAACSGEPIARGPLSEGALSVVVGVLDMDALVIRDCQESVRVALDRHHLGPALTGEMPARIDVAFPDGATADLTATLKGRDGKPVLVLASARSSFLPPRSDLRSTGGRARTYACDLGAERLAAEMAKRLGLDGAAR